MPPKQPLGRGDASTGERGLIPMIFARHLEQVRQAVLLDPNVNLAVVFGPTSGDGGSDLSLLLDCENGDRHLIQAVLTRINLQLGIRLRAYRLSDARPAAILMLQILQQGQVVKDYYGQWDRLFEETDVIEDEAERHERFSAALQTKLGQVVEDDAEVTLAVVFAPIGSRDLRADLNLLVSCSDEEEQLLLDLLQRLRKTGFHPSLMPLSKALAFPFALSHIVRTGQVIKDSAGQWKKLQSERERIVRAGLQQHANVQLARRWAGGRNGSASLN